MRKLLYGIAILLALTLGSAAQVATTKATLGNNLWTNLGPGPLLLSPNGQVVYAVSDVTPTITVSEGFPLPPNAAVTVNTASNIWARAVNATPTYVYWSPILAGGGSSGGGGGAITAAVGSYSPGFSSDFGTTPVTLWDSLSPVPTGTINLLNGITSLYRVASQPTAISQTTPGISNAVMANQCNGIINIAQTANAALRTFTAGKFGHICGGWVISDTAQKIGFVEGAACNTSGTATPLAATGAANAPQGSLAPNGGTLITPFVMQVAGDTLCLLQSGAGQIGGQITYIELNQ